MEKCDCYRESNRFEYNPIIMKGVMNPYSYCNGTRERDECSCGGDRTKCDFYPEVIEEAKKELVKNSINIGEDCLTITYDCNLQDAPTLCVGRIKGDNLKILNIFHGDKALYTYALLTGNAEWKDLQK